MNYPAPQWMKEDHWAYERRVLRNLLTARTREGLPAICAESFLRDCVDDLSVFCVGNRATPEIIRAWANGNEDDGGNPHVLGCIVCQSYRVMVGVFS